MFNLNNFSRVPDQNGVSTTYHASDTPFWSGTLEIHNNRENVISSTTLNVDVKANVNAVLNLRDWAEPLREV